jgi:hypothetical protein
VTKPETDIRPIPAGSIRFVRTCVFGLFLLCLFCPEPAWGKEGETALPSTGPWFTGTLLSTRGSTVDQGHMVVEPYFYVTRFGGLYNNNWRLQSATTNSTYVQQVYFIYGLTSRIDVEFAPQWVRNHSENETVDGFGDFPLQLGFQVMRSPPGSWLPDVRLWAQETFPTGSHNRLSHTATGLGGTGGGSFATTLGIGVQKAIRLTDDHVLRYRLNASYGFYSPVSVQGFNSYGGGFGTDGRVEPGPVTTLTAAGEYTVTRHVVLALDVSFQIADATRFSGANGFTPGGDPATVGKGYSEVLTIAPAVEYLWNEHVGIIAGPWFSLRGRNTSEFFGVVAALYLYL